MTQDLQPEKGNSPASNASPGDALNALRSHALEVLDAGVVVCDIRLPGHPIIYVNPGFERLTGYSADEVLGRNCRFLQGSASNEATTAEIRSAIAEGRECVVVIRNYRKDGSAFWNELRLSPTHDEAGRLTYCTGILTDVTEKIEAQQRLHDSENQLRALLDSTAEAIYGLDENGRCTFCNPSCARMLGYDAADELIGQDMHELIHNKHADGTAHPREECRIFRAYLEGTGTHSDTEVFWRRDGTAIPVEYWSYPILRGKRVVGCVVNFLDLTERHEAASNLLARTRRLETINEINIALAGQLELSKLVQQVTDAGRVLTGAEFGAFFYSLPDDHGKQYTLYALSGVARDEFETLPMPRRTEIFAPTFEDGAIVRIDDVLTDTRYGKNTPHAGIPSGHISVRSYLAVPVAARNGESIGALLYGHGEPQMFDETDEQLLSGIAAQTAVAIDNARLYESAQREIQERKQVEIALEDARRAADQANRSKSEFLANMSHEIRTPMTAILGYADILAAHLQDADNRECVEVIKSNGRFLLDIIDDILDLSKIETGNLRIERQLFRLDDLVSDVRSLMEVRAQEKQLPLLVQYRGVVPAQVETDPTRLRQILINLVSNAIKFTESGSVRLLISYQTDNRGKSHLRFDVVDTGIGIEPDFADIIFNPFRQVDNSITRQFGGTGLGLAISQRLAQMLGGSIAVDSTPGEGSTFSLEIATDLAQDVKLITPSEQTILHDDRHGSARRIHGNVLVVDDRRDIRYVAQYFLEEAGASVSSAENGRAALDLITESGDRFDVVLMDMQMPELDGYTATRMLRERGFDKPIIALSAGAMHQERERALDAGCDMHVAKPVDGVELVNIVAGYMRDRSPEGLARQRAIRAKRRPDRGPIPGGQDADAAGIEEAPGKRLLVVDDSVDAADAMSRVLQLMGHEVAVAHSGQEALERAAEFAPEAVLLDLGLPDIDGFEVARRMRAEPGLRHARLFAVSGRSVDTADLGQAGFEDHFLKPAELAEIHNALMATAGQPEQQ